MKSLQFSTILAIAVLFVTSAVAQSDISNETSKVCGFMLSTSTGYIQRTDDYDLVPETNSTLWPTAQLYITPKGVNRLYAAGNGDRCGFDTHFQCLNTSATIVSDKKGFYIGSNSSLFYADQSIFWLCANIDAKVNESGNAPPCIFPPVGTTSYTDYSNCTPTTLVASGCQQSAEYSSDPSAVASPAAGDTGTTTTTSTPKGEAGKTRTVSRALLAGSALILVGNIMACL